MKLWRIAFWTLWVIAGCFAILLVSCGPVKLTIARANLQPNGPAATPPLITQETSLEQWENNIAPQLRDDFQRYIYGYFPKSASTQIQSRKPLSDTAFGGLGTAEEFTLIATAQYGDSPNETRPFRMVVVRPKDRPGASIILMETFCPNHNTVPIDGVSPPSGTDMDCGDGGIMSGLMTYVFGRYIAAPPLEMILQRGYGVAAMFPPAYVPDRKIEGVAALSELTQGHGDKNTRLGAIGAWGWGFSRMVDALETAGVDGPYISYGHSRYGKAALVAAAFDARINGVIAHQSGTGGAALSKDKKGESVGEITKSYPHWFAPAYGKYADRENDLPLDQHALLALIAPRPIFIGNARRDVWSDPNASFRAAQGASPAYKLYGKQGLSQGSLKPFHPAADISFYIRPGTHGVVKEDWPAFLEFLDAHFK